jgi:purine-binding chemotaxis protein CheW
MKTDPAAHHSSPAIDWSVIHKRVETARQALERETTASPTENLANLKRRAHLLAREPQQTDEVQEFLEIVEFRLGVETYGIESAFVREIYPLKEFTLLPGLPAFVIGIVNVRGQILSIIDLKKFFEIPETGLGQLNRLIILRNEQMEFGVLADEIVGARSIARKAIEDTPSTVTGIGAAFLRGIIADRLILLDAENILNAKEIIVHQEPD